MSLTAHELAHKLLEGPDLEVRVWDSEFDTEAPTVTFDDVFTTTVRERTPSDLRRRRDVDVVVLS